LWRKSWKICKLWIWTKITAPKVEQKLEKTIHIEQKTIKNINYSNNKKDSIWIKFDSKNDNFWKNKTIELIKKYEWVRFSAYCDNLIHKNWKYIPNCPTWKERFSIWYWSTSFRWEKINQNEADKRIKEYLENNVFNELENLTCYNDNQKIAIADFMYNSWKYTKHIYTWKTFLFYVKNCDKKTIEWYLAPWLYKAKWLKLRRQAEYNFWKWIEKY